MAVLGGKRQSTEAAQGDRKEKVSEKRHVELAGGNKELESWLCGGAEMWLARFLQAQPSLETGSLALQACG